MTSNDIGPTKPADRIISLDALRGFALLGILTINIWYFSMPLAGALLPPLYGDFTGINYGVWVVSHVFFEMKFMTLFTILFGAGIVLFTNSKERRGQAALRLHFRRTILLLLIGLGHAYLLWYGDILVTYAFCAVFVVFARHWNVRRLVVVGVFLLLVPSLIFLSFGASAMVADEAATAEIESDVLVGIGADEAGIEAELATYRGGWLDQMDHRIPTAFSLQTVDFIFSNGWRVGGLMLIGMALFKSAILTNARTNRFYRRKLLIGSVSGIALISAGIIYKEMINWQPLYVLTIGFQFNYWGSVLLAFGYVSGMMLWCQARPENLLTRGFAAVGRTAFSNYLLQTILATSLFYGHGLGWFGSVSRAEMAVIVLAIWAIQIPLSMLWLRWFQFGPVEWIWRTLTYGETQPVRTRSS